jgi:hypothetical protein
MDGAALGNQRGKWRRQRALRSKRLAKRNYFGGGGRDKEEPKLSARELQQNSMFRSTSGRESNGAIGRLDKKR